MIFSCVLRPRAQLRARYAECAASRAARFHPRTLAPLTARALSFFAHCAASRAARFHPRALAPLTARARSFSAHCRAQGTEDKLLPCGGKLVFIDLDSKTTFGGSTAFGPQLTLQTCGYSEKALSIQQFKVRRRAPPAHKPPFPPSLAAGVCLSHPHPSPSPS